MRSIAVANENTNRYKSVAIEGELTPLKMLELVLSLDFPGPFTLIEEQGVYLPHDDKAEFPEESLNPDSEIIVYDSYGPRGIQRIGTGYESTVDVKDWIDANWESKSDGEYTFGHVIPVSDLE